jgi:hypothetical protein
MLRQFLVGGAVSVVNIVIHALVMTIVVRVAHAISELRADRFLSLILIAVMVPTVTIFMVAHTLEVFVWSAAYAIVGAAPANADVVYFAFANYATLGYGDVLPLERWRLFGPITAMNGMLLFGWSTAVIFEVLRRTLVRTIGISDRAQSADARQGPARRHAKSPAGESGALGSWRQRE